METDPQERQLAISIAWISEHDHWHASLEGMHGTIFADSLSKVREKVLLAVEQIYGVGTQATFRIEWLSDVESTNPIAVIERESFPMRPPWTPHELRAMTARSVRRSRLGLSSDDQGSETVAEGSR